MIGVAMVGPLQPGPCVICGGTDYNLSCGGPSICPKCDCGMFDAVTVMKQAKAIAGLRELARELSDALLTVRPLGGSEMFRMQCGEYYADPTACKATIAQLRNDLHESRKEAVRAKKARPGAVGGSR